MEFDLLPRAIGGAQGEVPCALLPCIMDASRAGQNRVQELAQCGGVEAVLWNHSGLVDCEGVPTAWALSSIGASNALSALDLAATLFGRGIAVDQAVANEAGALAAMRTVQELEFAEELIALCLPFEESWQLKLWQGNGRRRFFLY